MAHRGDSSSVPENTMLALKSAAEIGVDVLETDVRLTKDEELVLFHDESLQRMTGDARRVDELTLDELMRIDLGEKFTTDGGKTFPFRGAGLTVVTLKEALEAFPDHIINIDMKDKRVEIAELLANVIKDENRENSVIVGSFHGDVINRFRNIIPEVKTAASPSEVTRFVFALKMRVIGIYCKHPKFMAFQVPKRYGRIGVVNRRFIKAAHSRGIAVHVWTINDIEAMKRLIDLGVDGIFTDRPRLLREILIERGLIQNSR